MKKSRGRLVHAAQPAPIAKILEPWLDAIEYLRAIDKLPANIRTANTAEEPLPGAIGWPDGAGLAEIERRLQELMGEALERDTIKLLTDTYGMRSLDLGQMIKDDSTLKERLNPARPEIFAQVKYAVEKELALTICDVLVRRTQIFFREADQGLNCLERVAEQMATLLGWDEEKKQGQIRAYREEVERSRRWQEE